MAGTVGDFVWERLQAWGVRHVFGYPGDGIGGLMGALDRTKGAIGFTQVRHEETAGLMACGWAKFTGEVGVCLATSGPGAIHLLNGLYDAQLDHQPVLALVGQQARSAMGSSYQQDVDLQSLFKDVAGAFVQTATTPAQVRHLIDRAYRIAKAERTVTCVILPNDLQLEAMEQPGRAHGFTHSGVGLDQPVVLPSDAALDRAAALLDAAERPAILVGAGALGAGPEVAAVAEALGAGVAKALLGKAVLADDLPYVTGSIGLLGTRASWEMMSHCDALLMVGSGFPYTEFSAERGAGARRADRHLAGDARAALPDGGESGGRRGGDVAGAAAATADSAAGDVAGADGRMDRDGAGRGPVHGDGVGRSDQSAARVLGAVLAAA